MMRIITGEARGVRLESPKDESVRPTTEMTKEGLFSSIQFEIEGRRVLDLFAGSGQLGLEAVSRGASHAVLVDHDRAAIRCIQQNITALHFDEESRVIPADWRTAVAQLTREGSQFDLIFLDPPYQMHDLTEVSSALIPLLAEDALVVVEHEVRTMPALCEGFDMTDTRKYGIVGVSFFQYVGQGG